MDLRIDERSYREQGKADIPQVHEGSSVRHMEAKGIETDKGELEQVGAESKQETSRADRCDKGYKGVDRMCQRSACDYTGC